MSEDGRNDFEARIARIKSRHGAGSEQQADQDHQSAGSRDRQTRQDRTRRGMGDRMGGLFMICAVFLALGAFGYFSTIGRDSAVVAGLSKGLEVVSMTARVAIGGPPGGQALPSTRRDDPSQLRKLVDQGWEYRTPAVAAPDQTEIVLADMVSGYNALTALGEIASFTANRNCTLRRPREGEVVRNVRLESGNRPGPLQAFSEAQMAAAVTESIRGYMRDKKPYLQDKRVSGQFHVIDVFLTDTSAPVYLMLQALNGNVLWNIQPAPGVTIAHVAMIGDDMGLIDRPDVPSFEAIRIGDFIEGRKTNDDLFTRACMVRPFRAPEPHWPGEQKAAKNNQLFVNQMHVYKSEHREYAAWYEKTLGAPVNAKMTSARTAAHVLVGPAPATPVAYQSVDGAKVHLLQNDYVITGPRAARTATINDLHMSALKAAAGGDLTNLTYMPQGDPS
ncbi:MAG: hypothetical protein AAF641_11835 [Pseudomonadota bacterium]